MYMQRIPLEEVPEDEAGAAKWLHDLYVKKVTTSHTFFVHMMPFYKKKMMN